MVEVRHTYRLYEVTLQDTSGQYFSYPEYWDSAEVPSGPVTLLLALEDGDRGAMNSLIDHYKRAVLPRRRVARAQRASFYLQEPAFGAGDMTVNLWSC